MEEESHLFRKKNKRNLLLGPLMVQKLQPRFNSSKCHILHFVATNQHSNYFMVDHGRDSQPLDCADKERDLGIIVDLGKKLSFDSHIGNTVKESNTWEFETYIQIYGPLNLLASPSGICITTMVVGKTPLKKHMNILENFQLS